MKIDLPSRIWERQWIEHMYIIHKRIPLIGHSYLSRREIGRQ